MQYINFGKRILYAKQPLSPGVAEFYTITGTEEQKLGLKTTLGHDLRIKIGTMVTVITHDTERYYHKDHISYPQIVPLVHQESELEQTIHGYQIPGHGHTVMLNGFATPVGAWEGDGEANQARIRWKGAYGSQPGVAVGPWAIEYTVNGDSLVMTYNISPDGTGASAITLPVRPRRIHTYIGQSKKELRQQIETTTEYTKRLGQLPGGY
jgi:hypothetical protein